MSLELLRSQNLEKTIGADGAILRSAAVENVSSSLSRALNVEKAVTEVPKWPSDAPWRAR